MDWAGRRRFIILFILGAIAVAFLVIVLISALYKTPSCSDGVQNQDEAGIDCGGPCTYLCTALVQPPTILFTKVLDSGGRTDIVASIENKNTGAAAKNVLYRLTLYGPGQEVVKEMSGTIDLPPRATVVVYLPGVVSGMQKVSRAFLEVAASAPQWFTFSSSQLVVPTVVNAVQSGTQDAPRIEAILANSGMDTLFNVPVIVLVHAIDKSIIAASRTVISAIPAQSQATAIFTWNTAFSDTPASLEVVPTISLP